MLEHLHMVRWWADSCSLEYDDVVSRGEVISNYFAFNSSLHAVTLHLCVPCNKVFLCLTLMSLSSGWSLITHSTLQSLFGCPDYYTVYSLDCLWQNHHQIFPLHGVDVVCLASSTIGMFKVLSALSETESWPGTVRLPRCHFQWMRPDWFHNCQVHLLPKRKNISTLWSVQSQMCDHSEKHSLPCGHLVVTP